MKESDDSFRITAVGLVIACGVYELALSTSRNGHGWQFLAGITFVTFGVVRGWYLLKRSAKR